MSRYYQHPGYFSLSCGACEKYLHTDGYLDRDTSARGHGKLRERPRGTITPCFRCPKIPADAPRRTRQFAIELTPRSLAAFRHFRECKAVGHFPDDPIVRRNAAICNDIIEAIRDSKQDRLALLLEALRLGPSGHS